MPSGLTSLLLDVGPIASCRSALSTLPSITTLPARPVLAAPSTGYTVRAIWPVGDRGVE
jgi:hypothetical protein